MLITLGLALPAASQPVEEPQNATIGGFLYQTANTPQSYLITNEMELKSLVAMLSPVKPYKNLPAPPSHDRFLNGFVPDFEKSVLVVAVGRNRIENPPVYEGTEVLSDGTRQVYFQLPPPPEGAYPYGWAVYTAVLLPRVQGPTRVLINGVVQEKKYEDGFKRAHFPRL